MTTASGPQPEANGQRSHQALSCLHHSRVAKYVDAGLEDGLERLLPSDGAGVYGNGGRLSRGTGHMVARRPPATEAHPASPYPLMLVSLRFFAFLRLCAFPFELLFELLEGL